MKMLKPHTRIRARSRDDYAGNESTGWLIQLQGYHRSLGKTIVRIGPLLLTLSEGLVHSSSARPHTA